VDKGFEVLTTLLCSRGVDVSEINAEMDSTSLIKYIDEHLKHPSLPHYLAVEFIWWRERVYLNHANISIKENKKTIEEIATEWINSRYQSDHHLEYAERYIFGQIEGIEDGDRAYAIGVLDSICSEGHRDRIIEAREQGRLAGLSDEEYERILNGKSTQQQL